MNVFATSIFLSFIYAIQCGYPKPPQNAYASPPASDNYAMPPSYPAPPPAPPTDEYMKKETYLAPPPPPPPAPSGYSSVSSYSSSSSNDFGVDSSTDSTIVGGTALNYLSFRHRARAARARATQNRHFRRSRLQPIRRARARFQKKARQ